MGAAQLTALMCSGFLRLRGSWCINHGFAARLELLKVQPIVGALASIYLHRSH